MNKDKASHFSALRASTKNAVHVVSGTFFLLLLSSLFMLNFSFTAMAHARVAVKIKDFPVLTANSNPYGITRGPDNALWFTEINSNKIGRITLHGKVTEFPTPTQNSSPLGIVTGPDNALWFTEQSGNKVGRITSRGQVVEFLVPTAQAAPTYITRGPNNTLWFTEQSASKIGRVTIN